VSHKVLQGKDSCPESVYLLYIYLLQSDRIPVSWVVLVFC